jgi:hypothetical protein
MGDIKYIDVFRKDGFINIRFDSVGIESLLTENGFNVSNTIPFCNLFVDYFLDGKYIHIKREIGGFSHIINLFNMYIPLIRRKAGGDLLVNSYYYYHQNIKSFYGCICKMSDLDSSKRIYTYNVINNRLAKPYFEINIKNIIKYSE